MSAKSRPASVHRAQVEKPCPPWLCFTFDNPLRRLFHNPERILAPYVRQGDTVLDIGPGMGYFTISLARLAGPGGRVIAADLQPEMLEGIGRRARKAGLEDRIILHRVEPEGLGLTTPLDFCLAFWMVHEVPDQGRLFGEITALLKPGGKILVVEPRLHVRGRDFLATLETARQAGLTLIGRPGVALSQAVLLEKPAPKTVSGLET